MRKPIHRMSEAEWEAEKLLIAERRRRLWRVNFPSGLGAHYSEAVARKVVADNPGRGLTLSPPEVVD